MCTVSLIPYPEKENGFILTSNRDESPKRETLAPKVYDEKGVKMLYPKDTLAGGTWLGISDRQRVVCLLNGAFENHVRKENYRISRGVVVKELLSAVDVEKAIAEYDFEDVEPFTVILADWQNKPFYLELVWDGLKKHLSHLEEKGHLWSSSPLYTPKVHQQRMVWFREFQQNEEPTAENLWNFHHSAGSGDKSNNLVIDRGEVRTQSISQIVVIGNKAEMRYKDLRKNETSIKKMP